MRSIGANEAVRPGRRRLLLGLVRGLVNPLVLLLLAASAIAGATGGMVSFVIIVAISMISTTLDIVEFFADIAPSA